MKCPAARREHLAGLFETFPQGFSSSFTPPPPPPPPRLFYLLFYFYVEIYTSQTFSDRHIFRPSPSSSTSFFSKRSTRTAEFIIICEASNGSFFNDRETSFLYSFFSCCAVDLFRFIQWPQIQKFPAFGKIKSAILGRCRLTVSFLFDKSTTVIGTLLNTSQIGRLNL